MIIIPSIDIINGSCVRLTQGNYSSIKKYNLSPLKAGLEFKKQGASFLQIIDLDGSRLGRLINKKAIIKISKKTGMFIQVGGGIRNLKDANYLLNSGIDKIIIGTTAIEQKNKFVKILKKIGNEKIIAAVDIKDNQIMIKGWKNQGNLTLDNYLKELKILGLKYVLVTDIKKDGTLKNPNFFLMKKVVNQGFKVFAAGGITTVTDLKKLAKLGVYGAIIGKALYENKINLKETIPNFNSNNLCKRIIPCLDIKNGKVVKGTKFKKLIEMGDPIELGKKYSKAGADELVFLDISATNEKRGTLIGLVKKLAKKINIPFTVGGGINSLNDVKLLLTAGADKISIGTAAVTKPKLVKQISQKFGSQSLVISIDAKKNKNSWQVYINGGKKKTNLDAITFAKKMEQYGAGELLINSLNRDGTKIGYDLQLLQAISSNVNIPVIASSGAGKKGDFLKAFKIGKVDAVLAASLFHTNRLTINQLKKYLINNGIKIRL